jgi:hypothetical protein
MAQMGSLAEFGIDTLRGTWFYKRLAIGSAAPHLSPPSSSIRRGIPLAPFIRL